MESAQHTSYRKWLRYYLDFCSKYRLQAAASKSPVQFLAKLRQKRQAEWQVKQAAHAVSIYLESIKAEHAGMPARKPPAGQGALNEKAVGESSCAEATPGLREAMGRSFGKWAKAHGDLVSVIKTRHYSPKTLKSYLHWARKLHDFSKDREPAPSRNYWVTATSRQR